MQMSVKSTIPFPVQRVYEAMRDHMPELADYMQNLDSIVVKKRELNGDTLHLINQWNAKEADIPSVAQSFIDSNKTYWLDHAIWKGDEKACSWRLEMGFMPNRVKCSGRTSFVPIDDNNTEMRIEGSLALDLKGLVPRLILGRATKSVEKFVGKFIEPNFKKTSRALTTYLTENS